MRSITLAAKVVPIMVLALSACGSSAPSSQLVDARRAYDQARMSHARDLAPDRLLEAQRALQRAEIAHDDDANSTQERHLAYLASRKSAQAIAYADIKAAELELQDAEGRYQSLLEVRMRRASRREQAIESELQRNRDQLSAVRQELSTKGQALDERTRDLRRREQELASKNAQLEAEEAARLSAEQQAKAAMQSLHEIAIVKEEARGLVITLSGSVLFRFDDSALLPIAREQLDRVADALREIEDEQTIVIEGHTDARGTSTYNRNLSKARAEAVRAHLISRGVPGERIQAIGKGEDEPLANNKSAEGRANNRRVEIVISPPASARR